MDGCRERPLFGIPGARPTHCSAHKWGTMVTRVTVLRGCEVGGCAKYPSVGLPGQKATHCSEHRTPEMM